MPATLSDIAVEQQAGAQQPAVQPTTQPPRVDDWERLQQESRQANQAYLDAASSGVPKSFTDGLKLGLAESHPVLRMLLEPLKSVTTSREVDDARQRMATLSAMEQDAYQRKMRPLHEEAAKLAIEGQKKNLEQADYAKSRRSVGEAADARAATLGEQAIQQNSQALAANADAARLRTARMPTELAKTAVERDTLVTAYAKENQDAVEAPLLAEIQTALTGSMTPEQVLEYGAREAKFIAASPAGLRNRDFMAGTRAVYNHLFNGSPETEFEAGKRLLRSVGFEVRRDGNDLYVKGPGMGPEVPATKELLEGMMNEQMGRPAAEDIAARIAITRNMTDSSKRVIGLTQAALVQSGVDAKEALGIVTGELANIPAKDQAEMAAILTADEANREVSATRQEIKFRDAQTLMAEAFPGRKISLVQVGDQTQPQVLDSQFGPSPMPINDWLQMAGQMSNGLQRMRGLVERTVKGRETAETAELMSAIRRLTLATKYTDDMGRPRIGLPTETQNTTKTLDDLFR